MKSPVVLPSVFSLLFLFATLRVSAFATHRQHHHQPFGSTLLNAECRDGSLEVTRTFGGATETFDLDYKIYRPMALSSQKACPILVLHGGPSVPSNYLQPLVNYVPYRSIVFYDQLGCGQSDEPADVRA
jgi:pimeloyl-ACP methyl ester carboxylesterase